MVGLSQIFTIDLISIQPSKNSSQTHNTKVFLRKSKTFYLSQAIKWGSQIRKVFLNSKKNSCSQG